MGDTDCVIAYTTLPAGADADSLGRTLVEERLAACVSVQGPARSVYRWEGAIERAAEQVVQIKTTAVRLDALARRLRELHPYDVPELVALPVAGGDPAYLAWLREATTAGDGEPAP